MKVIDTGGGGLCTVQRDLPETGQGDLSLQRKKSKNLGSQVTPVQSYLFNSCGLGAITIERSRYSDEHCNPVPPHPSLKTGFSVWSDLARDLETLPQFGREGKSGLMHLG